MTNPTCYMAAKIYFKGSMHFLDTAIYVWVFQVVSPITFCA